MTVSWVSSHIEQPKHFQGTGLPARGPGLQETQAAFVEGMARARQGIVTEEEAATGAEVRGCFDLQSTAQVSGKTMLPAEELG